METATRLLHHPYEPPHGFAATAPAIQKASTIFFPNLAAMRQRHWLKKDGYTYGLHGTPASFTLEERLATLEGARHCLLAPSGLSAITLIYQALLGAGDAAFVSHSVYNPSRDFAQAMLPRWGCAITEFEPMQPETLRTALATSKAKTKLVWLEAAASITMEFPPLPELIAIAHAAGAIVALDSTWGAGLAYAPFNLGADFSVQALTKYVGGGGDLLLGSVSTQSDALYAQIRRAHMLLGTGAGASEIELALRGLTTLPLRYAAQDASARRLAAWLAEQPQIACVLHPALPGSPGHEHWQRCCPGHQAAGIFSLVFQPHFSAEQIDAFCEKLTLFKLGYSWGGPISLVMPYDLTALKRRNSYGGALVRLAIGLEAAADLQADLQQALQSLH